MRVVGVDYAAAGYSAVALAVDGEPVSAIPFHPNHHKNTSDATRLVKWERWLFFVLEVLCPDVIAVEQLAVFQNPKVIRALSHHEGVALLVAKKKAPIVCHYTPSQARSVCYGKGNLSKDKAWEQRERAFPGFDFGRKTVGGTDKMDAMAQAVGGPILLERKK